MNWDIIFAVIFYSLVLLFFFKRRDRFELQGRILAVYRTRIGIKLMDRISKSIPSILKFLGYIGIYVGFASMVFIVVILIQGTLKLITVPGALPSLAPLLPGVKTIPGAPAISFWHWLISIFIVAVIHEFSHGVIARVYNLKIKSSGFAFLGPILAAFVEPDEEELKKRSKKVQLSIFAAGPVSNLLLGLIFFLIVSNITFPLMLGFFNQGVFITQFSQGSPAEASGIGVGEEILNVNNISLEDTNSFVEALKNIKPGDEVYIKTDKGDYNVVTTENPENKTKAYLGVIVSDIKLKEQTSKLFPGVFLWFNQLFTWIFIISIGIGLFNLLPLGPVDGGRMFNSALGYFITEENKVSRIWSFVSLFILFLIFINFLPFLIKLMDFILKMFAILISLI